MNAMAAPALASVSPTLETQVAVIDSARGFAALRSEWNALLEASASASPFLTWEWLHTWWSHLSDAS